MDNNKSKEIKLGPVEKIPLGQGFCFQVRQEEVAVFRSRKGGLHAVQNRCPHRQGPLCEGVMDEKNVICPYHGHKFDIQTGEGSESGESVKTFRVREVEGQVFLKLEENGL